MIRFMKKEDMRKNPFSLRERQRARHRKKIEALFQPSYSPEPDPDERLDPDLKHKITTTAPVRTCRLLEATTIEYMQLIERSPERVNTL